MLGSLIILLVVALIDCGGIGGLWTKLYSIDQKLVSLEPENLILGVLPFILSWMAGGFGVIGQPHIVIRVMALN